MGDREGYSFGYDLARGPDRTATYFWDGTGAYTSEPPDPPRHYIDECVTLTPATMRSLMAWRPREGHAHRCRRGRWWWK